MIHYSLVCDDGHDFESWFRDSGTFESQAANGLVSCPFCNSTKIARAVMAPRLARRRDDDAQKMSAVIRQLRENVIAGTEDVGDRFPEEARKIEEGEAERRPIRGRATFEEAKALLEEGIEIMPLPGPPSDGN